LPVKEPVRRGQGWAAPGDGHTPCSCTLGNARIDRGGLSVMAAREKCDEKRVSGRFRASRCHRSPCLHLEKMLEERSKCQPACPRDVFLSNGYVPTSKRPSRCICMSFHTLLTHEIGVQSSAFFSFNLIAQTSFPIGSQVQSSVFVWFLPCCWCESESRSYGSRTTCYSRSNWHQ